MGPMFKSGKEQVVPVIFPEHGLLEATVWDIHPADAWSKTPYVVVRAGNLVGGYSCVMEEIDGVLYSYPPRGKTYHEVTGHVFTVWDPKTDW